MFSKLTVRLFLFGFCFLGLSVQAEEVAPPPISSGMMIQIQDWDKKSHTYEVVKTKYPAQGPNYATLADLLKSIQTLDAKRVKKNPKSIVSNEYKLDAELRLQPILKTMNQRQVSKKKK